jgi:hypothetical protein
VCSSWPWAQNLHLEAPITKHLSRFGSYQLCPNNALDFRILRLQHTNDLFPCLRPESFVITKFTITKHPSSLVKCNEPQSHQNLQTILIIFPKPPMRFQALGRRTNQTTATCLRRTCKDQLEDGHEDALWERVE